MKRRKPASGRQTAIPAQKPTKKGRTRAPKVTRRAADQAIVPARKYGSRAAPRDLELNASALAAFFGVSRPAIHEWCVKGCPRLPSGLFSASAVAKWDRGRREKDSPAAATAKDRLTEAKTEMAELELARVRRQVVAVEHVQAMARTFCDVTKAESRNMVDAIAMSLGLDQAGMAPLVSAREAFLRRTAAAMEAAQDAREVRGEAREARGASE